MKIPKRIAEILKRKQDFIDAQRGRMEETVIKLQSDLLSDIVAQMIPELDVKNGLIQDTSKNYRLISQLDKTYKLFQVSSSGVIIAQVIGTTEKITQLSNDYFNTLLFKEGIPLTNILSENFNKITESANKLTNLRLGLDGGKLVRGGFLKSFFDSNTLGTDLKQITSHAVTSNMDMKDYVKMLNDKIIGTQKTTGGLERQYQRYAYDVYQQYDAAYNQKLGNEFGFSYFIYQGGIIRDSREFCVEHNNKVYSIDETKDWCDWVSPTTGEKPTYMCYEGYDPLIDRGGYNCRHALGWIGDELAFQLRPDLKE